MIGLKLLGPWKGIPELTAQELKRLKKPIERAITKAQLLFESEVKKTLTGKRTGRIYFRGRKAQRKQRRSGKTGRDAGGRFIRFGSYQASAPGEPPAFVQGNLRKSITHGPVMWDGDNASGVVGTNAVQAHIMEYGGVTGAGHHVRILARPYMAPTFLRVAPRLDQILAEATQS